MTTVRDSVTAPVAPPSLVRTATMSTWFASPLPSAGRIRMAARSPPLTSRMADRIESNSASAPIARDRMSDTLGSVVKYFCADARRSASSFRLEICDRNSSLVGSTARCTNVWLRVSTMLNEVVLVRTPGPGALGSSSSRTVEPMRSLSPFSSSMEAMRRSLTNVPFADCRSATTHRFSRAAIVQCRRDAASSSRTTSQPFRRPRAIVCPVLRVTVRPASLPDRTTNSNRMGR